MLVMRRKEQERILIGAEISVVVLETGRHEVRLGVHAPETVPIVRDDAVVKGGKIGPGCCPCCGCRLAAPLDVME